MRFTQLSFIPKLSRFVKKDDRNWYVYKITLLCGKCQRELKFKYAPQQWIRLQNYSFPFPYQASNGTSPSSWTKQKRCIKIFKFHFADKQQQNGHLQLESTWQMEMNNILTKAAYGVPKHIHEY